jgi:hypothetical protein
MINDLGYYTMCLISGTPNSRNNKMAGGGGRQEGERSIMAREGKKAGGSGQANQ